MPVGTIARSLAWDDFRLINAIAGAGTLPAAAALLGLDHSTVFRRLRQIEAALGTPVFERHRSGYVPTAAGTEIAALAARVDEDITSVLRRVAGQSPSPAGEVRVATSDGLLLSVLMPLFAELRRACPNLRLDLVTGNAALNLSRRDADVAIRTTASPSETLVGRKLARIGWAVYGPAAAPPDAAPHEAAPTLTDAPALTDAATLMATGQDWVGFGDALAGIPAHAMLAAHVPAARIACRFDTVVGVAAAIAAGIGPGLLPCPSGERGAGLVRLSPPIPALATDLWLLTHADLRHVPRIRVLMDFLGERLSALRSMIEGAPP